MNEKFILIIGLIAILVFFYIVLKLCSKFRSKVYKLFIHAEKNVSSGVKMDYVVEQIYSYLPNVLRIFITEKNLRWILQKMFNTISDFLNDGKFNRNGSGNNGI